MKWAAAVLALAIVLGAVLALAPRSEAGKRVAASPVGQSRDLTRSSEIDGIVLLAALSPPAEGRLTLDFELNTHSGSLLGFDPRKNVRLWLNGRETPASIRYTPKTESAHHRSGRLEIAAPGGGGFMPSGSIRRVALEFANLGLTAGSAVLEWQFEEAGK